MGLDDPRARGAASAQTVRLSYYFLLLTQPLLTRYPTRLRTRMAWVQNSEKSLEEKRQHCKSPPFPFIFPFHSPDLPHSISFLLTKILLLQPPQPILSPSLTPKNPPCLETPPCISLSQHLCHNLRPNQPSQIIPNHSYNKTLTSQPPANNHRHQSRPSL